MSIICGTDFSTPAAMAGRVAARLAARAKEPLFLVHAINELGAEADFAAGRGAAYEPLRRRLGEEARRLRDLGAEVHEVLAPGFPDQLLAATAAEQEGRLLVVASVGTRSPDAWLLGSVPDRLAVTAEIPTLVVRGDSTLEPWLRGEAKLRVVAGIDDGATGEAVARFLPELRRLGACDVTATRVAWPPGERLRLGLDVEGDRDALSREAQRILERELAGRLGTLPGDGEVRLLVAPGPGRVDDHLVRIAEDLEADVVVVGTHRRTGLSRLWHGSVSRGVLQHAPMSVLVVPTTEAPEEAPIRRWRSLLATTDGSPFGDRAIPEAYAALSPGGVVHLLTVLDVEPAAAGEVRRARERLEALVPADAGARGLRTEIHVLEDHAVARAIGAAAERLGVDALCLSTHGRSGLSAALTGSVARDVLAASRRPVVLVRARSD